MITNLLKYVELQTLGYERACKLLQDKYGQPSSSYFTDPNCTTKNISIRRVSEGLFIHHIDEYNPKYPFATGISSTSQAIRYPFELQQPEHLCYCNYIEHMILHLKIYDIRRREMDAAGRIYPLDDGLTMFIIPELVELFYGTGVVKDRKDSYFSAIKEDRVYFSILYDDFYRQFPTAPKHVYNRESIVV